MPTKIAVDKLAKELLDQVNKAPAKEHTAAEPELEVILIEDELIDSAREPTGDQVIPNINIIDNLDNIINVTDDYSFKLDSLILRPKPFTMVTNKEDDKTPSLTVTSDSEEVSDKDDDDSDNDSQVSRNTKDDSHTEENTKKDGEPPAEEHEDQDEEPKNEEDGKEDSKDQDEAKENDDKGSKKTGEENQSQHIPQPNI